jgi:hypothetical protein
MPASASPPSVDAQTASPIRGGRQRAQPPFTVSLVVDGGIVPRSAFATASSGHVDEHPCGALAVYEYASTAAAICARMQGPGAASKRADQPDTSPDLRRPQADPATARPARKVA